LSLIALFQLRQTEAGFTLDGFMTTYMGLMGWFVAFGIIILTQGDIVEEKQSGTAEWVPSSPLSRESFILSKLAVNLGWLLLVLVLVNGVVFNLVIEAVGVGFYPWIGVAQALGLQGLALVFWLALVIMLGTFFRTRNAVIGVPLIFLFTQTLIPTIVGPSGRLALADTAQDPFGIRDLPRSRSGVAICGPDCQRCCRVAGLRLACNPEVRERGVQAYLADLAAEQVPKVDLNLAPIGSVERYSLLTSANRLIYCACSGEVGPVA
jgi:ABC-2 family transporter protein